MCDKGTPRCSPDVQPHRNAMMGKTSAKETHMDLEHLSKESLERLGACNDVREALTLLGDEGVELTDEQLEGVVGGIISYEGLDRLFGPLGRTLSQLLPDEFETGALWNNAPTIDSR